MRLKTLSEDKWIRKGITAFVFAVIIKVTSQDKSICLTFRFLET